MSTRTLVLFDIDGTLVLTGRAGVRGMNRAFARLHGVHEALEGVAIAGRTDRAIVIDVMKRLGIDPTESAIAALRAAYIEDLRVEITRPVAQHPSCVLPGVSPLLDVLATQDTAVTALLTGNFQQGAAVKLGHFSLWDRFAFGAFGDEHVDRSALVPIALRHSADAGISVEPERVVIIGDTPHDINCAKAHNARAIGVATGPFTRQDLVDSGADLAVDTLEDTDRIVSWMLQ